MTRVTGSSMFSESFVKCAFCFPSILLVAFFAFNHSRVAGCMAFNLSSFICRVDHKKSMTSRIIITTIIIIMI